MKKVISLILLAVMLFLVGASVSYAQGPSGDENTGRSSPAIRPFPFRPLPSPNPWPNLSSVRPVPRPLPVPIIIRLRPTPPPRLIDLLDGLGRNPR